MAIKQISRLEVNRDVRRILVRHGVDTTKLQFSCHSKSISLSGELYKEGGKDIDLCIIEALLKDFNRLGVRIVCELSNWSITEGAISKKGHFPKTSETKNTHNEQGKKVNEAASDKLAS